MGGDYPTEQEIQEKLIELAYAWGDIEEQLEGRAVSGGAREAEQREAELTSALVGRAFRVEAVYEPNDFGDPCTWYVLLYDVEDATARECARDLPEVGMGGLLSELIHRVARPWHRTDNVLVKQVPKSTPVDGELCRRLGQDHPAKATPTLDDVPIERPESAVGLIERDGYWLTPIEAPFYDALRDTGLTFAVQPRIQGTDRHWRLDFLVFQDGRAVAVELDGHDWHKTKQQRSHDAARDRWFAERKIETLRWTGSQVHDDPQGCVSELLNVLRTASARA